jgi:hypothetical protein
MLLLVGGWDSRGLSVFPVRNYVNDCLLLGICAEVCFVVWRTAVYYIGVKHLTLIFDRQPGVALYGSSGDWYFDAPDTPNV